MEGADMRPVSNQSVLLSFSNILLPHYIEYSKAA